jgi:predicted dehydrogenase
MRKIKVGVLGLGRGLTFARQFNALPESQTAALCDATPARLQAAVKSLNIPDLNAFTSYEEMLRSDVEIVVVASGVPDHGKHVCMALEAGKHVLSEVPADVSLNACKEIVKTVRRTKRKYMLAENCCYWGYIREYRRLVASGRLGDVLYAEGEYLHHIPELCVKSHTLGPNASHEEILKHPETKLTWRAAMRPITYLTHDLGPLLEILDDRCVSVSCLATPSVYGPRHAPAAEVGIFKTAKERVIKILVEFSLPRPAHHYFMLMGTKGSVESPRGPSHEHLLWIEGENMNTWSRMAWDTKMLSGPREAWASGHGGADWHVSRGFLDSILKDTEPPIDVYRAMDYTVPGICAVESAAKGGAAVKIPDLRKL